MSADWRALCAELVDDLSEARVAVREWADYASDYFKEKHDLQGELERIERLITHARAALAAEPQGEGPTDGELLRVASNAIDPYDSCGIALGEYEAETEAAVEAYGSELIAFARAVLARWGRPAPPPADELLHANQAGRRDAEAAAPRGAAMSDRPPLWEVLRMAYATSPLAPRDADDGWTDRHGYAAEIRAVRDWLVPEEVDQPNGEVSPAWDAVMQRQRLRALLTAEADRAERGDQSTSESD